MSRIGGATGDRFASRPKWKRDYGAGSLGFCVAVGAWLLLVPWDLSELDPNGRPIPGGGGDHFAPRIALAFAVVVAVGLVLAVAIPSMSARRFTMWGGVAWALLFAWRAGASRVSGANLWPVSFVMFVVPAVVAATFAVSYVERWQLRRGDRSR